MMKQVTCIDDFYIDRLKIKRTAHNRDNSDNFCN